MRSMKPVFGAAVEILGFTDWIIHERLESSVDAYLDRRPVQAFWHHLDEGMQDVVRRPVVGVPRGEGGGLTYVAVPSGAEVGRAELEALTEVGPEWVPSKECKTILVRSAAKVQFASWLGAQRARLAPRRRQAQKRAAADAPDPRKDAAALARAESATEEEQRGGEGGGEVEARSRDSDPYA